MRRVVVTGLGVLCPTGSLPKQAFHNLLLGQSGIRLMPEWRDILDVHIAAPVRDFNPEDWIEPKKDIRRMERFIQLAVAAASQAWRMAELPAQLNDRKAPLAGCILGTGFLGIHSLLAAYDSFKTKGAWRISPLLIPAMLSNLAPGHIAIRYNLQGPNWTSVSACASSTHAIGEAFMHIRHHRADLMLAGGSESALDPLAVAGFSAMRALCHTFNDKPEAASRPFDRKRCGFVMGEGAGVLILEALEHAKQRGAPILAEVIGYGSSCDAHHITAPDPEGRGARQAIQAALNMAQLNPEEVDYINAHGTSTPHNDLVETKAIKAALKDHALHVAISSTKSMTGHLLGAAGSIEAIFSIMTLQSGQIPPTINLDDPDPDCDLDYVPNKAREQAVRIAMSNSFGFGGTNAVLLFKNSNTL